MKTSIYKMSVHEYLILQSKNIWTM